MFQTKSKTTQFDMNFSFQLNFRNNLLKIKKKIEKQNICTYSNSFKKLNIQWIFFKMLDFRKVIINSQLLKKECTINYILPDFKQFCLIQRRNLGMLFDLLFCVTNTSFKPKLIMVTKFERKEKSLYKNFRNLILIYYKEN
ncbi:hypothetical protein BpHYR1_046933 [Brachionus plicatilis]|uniref:Uncharacterized protein n=1 Tax=Brachionus plicatilis TaxID=10195 RepID=A0A3M7RGC9_BRAPC|nr:hypothetical protein BpHYR1_046933 [Brachionus plicatilis]